MREQDFNYLTNGTIYGGGHMYSFKYNKLVLCLFSGYFNFFLLRRKLCLCARMPK